MNYSDLNDKYEKKYINFLSKIKLKNQILTNDDELSVRLVFWRDVMLNININSNTFLSEYDFITDHYIKIISTIKNKDSIMSKFYKILSTT